MECVFYLPPLGGNRKVRSIPVRPADLISHLIIYVSYYEASRSRFNGMQNENFVPVEHSIPADRMVERVFPSSPESE